MRMLVLVLFACSLAGCATTAERAAWAQREVEEMMQVYGPACEKLGFEARSDAWRDCVLRLSARDEYARGRYPVTTHCFGRPGIVNCTTF
jgi:hypothetical protein